MNEFNVDFPFDILPGGAKNRRGAQFERNRQRALKATIDQAVAAQLSATQGIGDAAAAQTAADAAQTTANQGVSDAASAQATAAAAQGLAGANATNLGTHAATAATTGALGHVRKAAALTATLPAALGPAGAVYSQAEAQEVRDAVNGLRAYLDELTTRLQTAGILT